MHTVIAAGLLLGAASAADDGAARCLLFDAEPKAVAATCGVLRGIEDAALRDAVLSLTRSNLAALDASLPRHRRAARRAASPPRGASMLAGVAVSARRASQPDIFGCGLQYRPPADGCFLCRP